MTGCIGGFFLIGLALVTADFEDSYYGPDSGFVLGYRIVWSVLAVIVFIIMIRWFRMGILATPSRLIVRNVFKTFRIPWADITGFERPASYGLWRNAGLQIRLQDGSTRYAALYAAGPFNRPTFAEGVLDELRQLHERFAGPSSTVTPPAYD